MWKFLQIIAIGSLCDILRAVVIQLQWNWFVTPWTHIIAPGVIMIWGLLVMKSAIFGFGKIEDEEVSDVIIGSLAATTALAVIGFIIHLMV